MAVASAAGALCGFFPVSGLYTDIHSTAQNPVGTLAWDNVGNGYLYLLGVANTAAGSWVTMDHAGATTLAVANGIGRVAIAKAAVLAGKWGWYGVYGNHNGLCLSGMQAADKVWLTATAGSVDDADVAVDIVIGALTRSDRDTVTGMSAFELNFPFCHNEVLN